MLLTFDIETLGLYCDDESITVLTWLYNGEWKKWINGATSNDDFLSDWESASGIITFNGKCFDERFVCHVFDIPRHKNHLDLRWTLRKKGLVGGLKKIYSDQKLPIINPVTMITGKDAPRLWRRHLRGCKQSLDVLLGYCAEDTFRTATLANTFEDVRIPCPLPPWTVKKDVVLNILNNLSSNSIIYTKERIDLSKKQQFNKILNSGLQSINLNGPLFGKTICFTGHMEDRMGDSITRSEATKIVNKLGIAVSGTLTRGVDHLISEHYHFQSAKNTKAREFNISILSPCEFWEMVDLGFSNDETL